MSERQIKAIKCQVIAITQFVTSPYSTCEDIHAAGVRQALRRALSEVSDDCKYRAEKRRCIKRMKGLAARTGTEVPHGRAS